MADLHMGYAIGVDHITNMVEKINQQDADIVIIAGDIFDNSYDGMDDPEGIKAQLKSIKSKYVVYAVYGNHDIDEKTVILHLQSLCPVQKSRPIQWRSQQSASPMEKTG